MDRVGSNRDLIGWNCVESYRQLSSETRLERPQLFVACHHVLSQREVDNTLFGRQHQRNGDEARDKEVLSLLTTCGGVFLAPVPQSRYHA